MERKHIISKHYGDVPLVSHAEVVRNFMECTKRKICKACSISGEEYDHLHYDLAYAWFEHHQYLEYTARVFLMSKVFHKWWNQQITQEEDSFLRKWGRQGIPSDKMRDALHEIITEMEIHPSAEARRIMHDEGLQVLRINPELWKINIYRHGRLAETDK